MRRGSGRDTHAGFTLVEVAFAVAILALAFTSIIAIQSNVTATSIADRNRFEAALFAQYLLTAMDLSQDKPQPGEKQASLAQALLDAGWSEDQVSAPLAQYSDWTVDTTVQSFDLLEIADAMRRIDLTVAWGNDAASQYRVTYFIQGDIKASL